MTENQKYIVTALLNGHFIRKRNKVHFLFDSEVRPLHKVGPNTIWPLKKLLKTDPKTKAQTLNLNAVRQLHGNNTIKKLYKQSKKSQ